MKQKHTQKETEDEKSTTSDRNSNWTAIDQQKITSRTVHNFDGYKVELTNIERSLWGKFTKAHLLMYYHSVYPYICRHLQRRPLSLHVKLIAPMAPGFYIKDMEERQPPWAEIFSIKRKHKKKDRRDIIDYLVCNEEATLQWMINLGCIDVNPWTSTVDRADQPSYIIIDLDPSDNDFSKAVESAIAAKEYFDQQKLKAFAKTSGKTGIHLYLPCSGFNFNQARSIAENICNEVHALVPSITTTSMSIDERGDKLYLDPNQNDFGDTVAAPYSLRPFHLPSVSTPLEWKEVKPGLEAREFTPEKVLERLNKKGDLFLKVHDEKIAGSNNKALRKLL